MTAILRLTHAMRRLVLNLSLLLGISVVFVASPSLYAQVSTPTESTNQSGQPEPGSTTTTDNNDISKDGEKNNAGTRPTSETVFNPSEEISEDSPVPFPVDI